MRGLSALAEKAEELREKALDLLFPPRCVGCDREGTYLCPGCLEQLRPPAGAYRPGNAASGEEASLVEPVAIDGIFSCFAMEGVTRDAVHHLKYRKYRGLRAVASSLGALLADHAWRSSLKAHAVIPVPLHPKRLRERGYNQAELLAKEVGKGLGIPAESRWVERIRHSPPQARSAGPQERRSNVRGAFRAQRRLDALRLLLVDDVCTTGATLDACAGALKAAGAEVVWGLTVTREV